MKRKIVFYFVFVLLCSISITAICVNELTNYCESNPLDSQGLYCERSADLDSLQSREAEPNWECKGLTLYQYHPNNPSLIIHQLPVTGFCNTLYETCKCKEGYTKCNQDGDPNKPSCLELAGSEGYALTTSCSWIKCNEANQYINDAYDCITCESGEYFDVENNVCTDCNSDNQFVNYLGKCVTCQDGEVADAYSEKCVAQCSGDTQLVTTVRAYTYENEELDYEEYDLDLKYSCDQKSLIDNYILDFNQLMRLSFSVFEETYVVEKSYFDEFNFEVDNFVNQIKKLDNYERLKSDALYIIDDFARTEPVLPKEFQQGFTDNFFLVEAIKIGAQAQGIEAQNSLLNRIIGRYSDQNIELVECISKECNLVKYDYALNAIIKSKS